MNLISVPAFLSSTLLLLLTGAAACGKGFAPRSVAYVLQPQGIAKTRAEAVARLAACDRDLIVTDYSWDGSAAEKWTPREIATIRNAKPTRRVIAYVSIGEAEDYRWYWRKEWVTGHSGRLAAQAPAFLDAVNPDWPGNYKVRYWQKEWQSLIRRYLDEIVAQGFDGIYLDIVDGFEFYEHDAAHNDWIDNRMNPVTRQSFRRDMIDWVKTIAARARSARPGFLVIPQNGSQLLAHADFLEAVDAIGIEDLFTDGNKAQPKEHVDHILSFLELAKKAGKPVLSIEYGTSAKARTRSIEGARQNGMTLLLTDRNLKTLGAAFP
jgi:cysteinyl-tRNA synthetase